MIDGFIERMFKGDKRVVVRFIIFVENDEEKVWEIVLKIYLYIGKVYIVGIIGLLGVGKLILFDKLIRVVREEGKVVGVIVIDLIFFFIGGVFFGDRIWM